MAPLPPGADSLDSTRFGLNSPAGRRQRVNGNDLIRDRTIGRQKLARDCFPPDPTTDPTDSRPPGWHAEPDRVSHENGPVADDTVARGTHNHDYLYPFRDEARVTGSADSDYVNPFENAEEGPNPWAGMTQFHMRTAVWDVNEDARDRIKMGPIAVWTRTSVEGGDFGEPTLRAVVGPLETQAFYEVRDVEYDPGFYTIAPVVEVLVIPIGHDRDSLLKLVRAGWDGKIDGQYIDATTIDGVLLADGSVPMTGDLDMDGNSIVDLADPVSDQDAATKFYVDSVAQGLAVKDPCDCATTANITLSGEQTIDGVLTSGSRVLVKDQTLPAENGIYVSGAGAWTRATDMNVWAEVPAAFTLVTAGTLNGRTGWVCTSSGPGVIGVDDVNWAQFSSSGFAPTVLRPAGLVGNQNNYNPGDMTSGFTIVFVTTTGSRQITGLDATGIVDGDIVVIINGNALGGGNVLLVNESGSSTAANRFNGPTGATVNPGEVVVLVYDGTLLRWKSSHPPESDATMASLRALGTSATSAAAGNDARIPTQAENDALVGTDGSPSSSNKYVTDSDARNTNTRTPTDGSVTKAKLSSQDVVDVKMSVDSGVTSTIDDGYCRVVSGPYDIIGILDIVGVLDILT